MCQINPLLVYLKTGIYPDILNNLKDIPCDKLILEYYPYPHPHNIARGFFLEHKEYTHLIIQPPDLLVTKENYLNLKFVVEELDYPVLSGVCNVDREGTDFFYLWNICKTCPDRDYLKRRYDYFPKCKNSLGIVQVGFMGMSFPFIRRDIIERTTIEGEPLFRGSIHRNNGIAPDLLFCNNCKDAGIKIMADTDVRMYHYANHIPSLVGKQSCKQTFIPFEENLIHG